MGKLGSPFGCFRYTLLHNQRNDCKSLVVAVSRARQVSAYKKKTPPDYTTDEEDEDRSIEMTNSSTARAAPFGLVVFGGIFRTYFEIFKSSRVLKYFLNIKKKLDYILEYF